MRTYSRQFAENVTRPAVVEVKSAGLDCEWGERVAREKFGDDAIDALPRFSRGPRKGKLKGKVGWLKVTGGGWYVRDPKARGEVVVPGIAAWVLLADMGTPGDMDFSSPWSAKILAEASPRAKRLAAQEYKWRWLEIGRSRADYALELYEGMESFRAQAEAQGPEAVAALDNQKAARLAEAIGWSSR